MFFNTESILIKKPGISRFFYFLNKFIICLSGLFFY